MDMRLVEIFLMNDVNRMYITLEDGTDIQIAHTMPVDGPGRVEEIFKAWRCTTNVINDEAFCEYVNNKRLKGEWDYYAMTKGQYFKLTHDYEASLN